MQIPAKNPTMGTLVVQGGFDSFMEEMYHVARAINDNYGYEIILFEEQAKVRFYVNTVSRL